MRSHALATKFIATFFAIALYTTPSFSACTGAASPMAGRAVGMDILNVRPGTDYSQNLGQLQSLPGSYQHFSVNWSSIETTDGKGSNSGRLEDSNNYLSMINSVATSSKTKITLIIRPIDTTGRKTPADLSDMNFNDPIMVKRFEKALDFIFTKIEPTNLVDVMIGNEVDTYNPGSDKDFWIEYANFLHAITVYVNTKYPHIPVGFVGTFKGLSDPSIKTPDGWPAQQVLQTFAKFVNVVGVTYYPLADDFKVRSPNEATQDLDKMAAAYPSQIKFHFTEVGYPSASENASSPEQQAAFYCAFMKAWDKQKDRIPYVSFLRLNDLSNSEVAGTASAYGLSSNTFTAYLRTLGLVDEHGTEKPALKTLKDELKRRGL